MNNKLPLRPTHHYISRAACGCVRGSAYDMGDKETGRQVAEWIASGLTVERLPHAEAVAAFKLGLDCQHPEPGQQRLELPL